MVLMLMLMKMMAKAAACHFSHPQSAPAPTRTNAPNHGSQTANTAGPVLWSALSVYSNDVDDGGDGVDGGGDGVNAALADDVDSDGGAIYDGSYADNTEWGFWSCCNGWWWISIGDVDAGSAYVEDSVDGAGSGDLTICRQKQVFDLHGGMDMNDGKILTTMEWSMVFAKVPL